IIAYRQPVTRGDIEDIRGVTVSTQVVKALEDRDWIEVIGHREAPGRPALFATTRAFLDDLGLRSLDELPALQETDPEAVASVLAEAGTLSLQELEQAMSDPHASEPSFDSSLPEGNEANTDHQGEPSDDPPLAS
ncbi:MAG: SMC-Scp complex subunit ScpB, partial [Pigmentiphaga sp.]